MCIDCVSEKSSSDRVGYFKILVFPFHDVGSLAICTNAILSNFFLLLLFIYSFFFFFFFVVFVFFVELY